MVFWILSTKWQDDKMFGIDEVKPALWGETNYTEGDWIKPQQFVFRCYNFCSFLAADISVGFCFSWKKVTLKDLYELCSNKSIIKPNIQRYNRGHFWLVLQCKNLLCCLMMLFFMLNYKFDLVFFHDKKPTLSLSAQCKNNELNHDDLIFRAANNHFL